MILLKLFTEEQIQLEKKSQRHQMKNPSTGSISWKTYKDFFLIGNSVISFILMTILCILPEISFIITNEWLSVWSRREPFDTQRDLKYPIV